MFNMYQKVPHWKTFQTMSSEMRPYGFIMCTKKTQISIYHNKPMYWGWQAWANSVDHLDQMHQNAAFNQELHYLPLTQQFSDTSTGSKMKLFKF